MYDYTTIMYKTSLIVKKKDRLIPYEPCLSLGGGGKE